MSLSLDIFISCASDDKELGRKLYDSLEKAGHKPWIFTENIRAGSLWWKQEVVPAMEKCVVGILLLSKGASKSYWCNNEHFFLLDRLHKEQTVRIFPVIAKKGFDLKSLFSHLYLIQAHDMSNNDEFDTSFSQLLLAIESDEIHPIDIDDLTEETQHDMPRQSRMYEDKTNPTSENSIHTTIIENLIEMGHLDIAQKLVTSQLWVDTCQALNNHRYDGYVTDTNIVWTLIHDKLLEQIRNG